MTKAQREQHKLGNQIRKLNLQQYNRKRSGRHFTSVQNGRYTAAASSIWSKFLGTLETI